MGTRSGRKPNLSVWDYWRLCDELTVVQAALLVVGQDPSTDQLDVEDWEPEGRPKGYEAGKAAISNALRNGAIKGKLVPEYDTNSAAPIEGSIDVHESRVDVSSLCAWLTVRGLRSGFFFPTSETLDYLDPGNPRYAPKLVAAIRAWQAVTDPSGQSPKKALIKWLRENAAAVGLTDAKGNPNQNGIEEVAKVANWRPGGGAPKTPVK